MKFEFPTITLVGGEDPEILRPYAYIPNGPAYWSREEFERHVAPENRKSFLREERPAPVPAPAPEEAIAVKKAVLPDGEYNPAEGYSFTVKEGTVVDEYDNRLFPAPTTAEELIPAWRDWMENFNE